MKVFQAEHVVPVIIIRHADIVSAPVGFDTLNRSLCEDPTAIDADGDADTYASADAFAADVNPRM